MNLKISTSARIAAVLAASALVTTGTSQANDYIGPVNGDFADNANWNPNYPTATGETGNLNSEATLSTAATGFRALRIGDSGTGIFNVTAGASISITTESAWDSWVGGGNGNSGTINQTGGSLAMNFVEVGRSAGATGTINLSGGTFVISRGGRSGQTIPSVSLYLGVNDSTTPGNDEGVGVMNISGGAFTTRAGVYVGSMSSFNVFGSGATQIGIGSDQNVDGRWTSATGSTLSFGIDGGGVTTIFIDDDDDSGITATFEANSILDLSFLGVPATAGTWTLLEAENSDITDNGLILSAATLADPNWSFNIDNSGINGLLTATYVPEPGTLGLLAAGGVLMLVRRRRK